MWIVLLYLYYQLLNDLCDPFIPTDIIFWMRPANKRRCDIVASPLVGWVHTQSYPCPILQGYSFGAGAFDRIVAKISLGQTR